MGNTKHDNRSRTQSRKTTQGMSAPVEVLSQGLLRVRKVAKEDKSTRFTSLLHHITPEMLRESYYELKRRASPGIDGLVWADYHEGLAERLEALHTSIHTGTYRAQPSLRVYIPKADGTKRPLGIAALEDKIVQQAAFKVLSAIYEADFYGFSYGFRPGRGSHDALDALYVAITRKKVNYVLDADIQGFFDSISHEWMLRFLERRVADKRMLRLIRKWLHAGVFENGEWSDTEVGTPQGAVISPLLANVFLHYVLDDWVVWWRKRHATGDVVIVRYADDFVMGFENWHEAELFLKALRHRLKCFALNMHPEKTRLIEFGRFAALTRRQQGKGKPETFTFLGFTHICSVTRKNRCFKLLRQTAKKRMRETLARIGYILVKRMHDDINEVGRWLRKVVQGYYQYFAVPGNITMLSTFRHALGGLWLKALRRRGQKRKMTWEIFGRVARHWIPIATPLHPYPEARFCAKHS